MEKFSAFRDPGTGMQPFLLPVAPSDDGPFATLLLPVRGTVLILRTFMIFAIFLLYCGLRYGLSTLLAPIPPLRHSLSRLATRLMARLALYISGFMWIQEEIVTKKRGKLRDMPWRPRAGDIIVSNWSSWVDVLWMVYRFDPIFVMPVLEEPKLSAVNPDSSPISYRPGRSRGSGVPSPSSLQTTTSRSAVKGFRQMSLFSMIWATGRTPDRLSFNSISQLKELRQSAERPVVVFPECTTSNGRGLLRFVDVFEGARVPTKQFEVFIMCIRYDPPTPQRPSPSHPIESPSLNPLPHLFTLLSSLSPQPMSIRMLPPSESPSSDLFLASEVGVDPTVDSLSEVCAILMARIGKMKRVRLGWEDKVAFLDLYWRRRK
ncbi:hypothetical protein EDD16DRAFT_1470768 [Pisolithus croceorrhizus]|nr:hypothetical protein EDD16DRAFT_1470768 [Pisolithus croceorrhizus]KAI6164766.1 hypothetical protein EDD17DRAFT_1474145 [Pisolithus thermaeus]